eukprot:s726_g33.t1
MWGHTPQCDCALCHSIPRVFDLIRAGQHNVGFRNVVLSHFRIVEAELRDELCRIGVNLVPIPGVAAPPAPEGHPGPAPESVAPAGEVAPTSHSGQSNPRLNLSPKTAPPNPPPHSSPGQPVPKHSQPVKAEPSEELVAPKEPGVVDVEDTQKEAASSSRKKPKEKRRSRRRGEEESPRDRSSHKRSRRSRSRGRRHHREEEADEREEEQRGKERKTRSERPPEPPGPPPHRRSEREWEPREPEYPPPAKRGWQGELPRSSHPRWSESTNKGQVKRAKQELYNRRRGR